MRIGIFGGGQLARMMALAAHPLGHEITVLDPNEACCAAGVTEHVVGAFDDAAAIELLASRADVITYEFENVSVSALQAIAKKKPVFPNPNALQVSQDRLAEKQFFETLGLPIASTHAVNSMNELVKAVVDVGTPCVLKTRRMGYDGRGQFVIKSEGDVQAAWDFVGRVPCVLEAFVPFERELAITAVRGVRGDMRFYPLVETVQRHGMLWNAFAPAIVPDEVAELAEQTIARAAATLSYVGVLTIEFFLDRHGYLIGNEMAPRVHNSAHWTIEGATTSQFENHVRAIAGLPLGDTSLRAPTVLFNIIGTLPDVHAVLGLQGAHLHIYGKEPKKGRKLGHISLSDLGDGTFEPNTLALHSLIDQTNQI